MTLKHIHTIWTFLLGAILLLGAPTMAYGQYLGPEEVLFESEFIYPPRPREAHERVKDQQAESTARREAVYDALERQRLREAARNNPEPIAQESGNDDFGLLGELGELLSALDGGGNNGSIPLHDTGFDNRPNHVREAAAIRRTDRLIDRVETNQRGFHAAAWQPLRSGAPLIGTGPETTMFILALIVAGLWTISQAWRKGRIAVTIE